MTSLRDALETAFAEPSDKTEEVAQEVVTP